MIFIETSIFTRQIRDLIPEGEYRALQQWLMEFPDAGALIRGSGGCRKLRWKTALSGKRGGIRVIYYWIQREDRILMLLAYSKSRQDKLTAEQLALLSGWVRRELGDRTNG